MLLLLLPKQTEQELDGNGLRGRWQGGWGGKRKRMVYLVRFVELGLHLLIRAGLLLLYVSFSVLQHGAQHLE